MAIILGVDPGSLKTGFGVIDSDGIRHKYIVSGVIRLPAGPLPNRLGIIFENLSAILTEFSPDQASVEEVFMAKNAGSAIKLGQARGAAVVACVASGTPVSEYTARQIKKAVVGTGGASKEQIQEMVRVLLKLPARPQEDAADALAAAICHANAGGVLAKMRIPGVTGRMLNGRLR
jgi:crossover junction endodeoxyribonuclease RuvC